jgi:hypothetical protein
VPWAKVLFFASQDHFVMYRKRRAGRSARCLIDLRSVSHKGSFVQHFLGSMWRVSPNPAGFVLA